MSLVLVLLTHLAVDPQLDVDRVRVSSVSSGPVGQKVSKDFEWQMQEIPLITRCRAP
jgi:hypothetical protein